MKYYIAADGGGTKLLTVLYDENYRILRTVKTAGTNNAFKPIEQIREETEAMVEELFEGEIGSTVHEIASADSSIVGPSDILLDAVSRHAPILEKHHYGEGHVALGATGKRFGCVAQAGTGSDAFLIQPGYMETCGGWGALLGDEGSGYDIGLRTLKAAIYAEDGRGPGTEILPILLEKWKLGCLYEIIDRCISDPDYRKLVASASYVTELAADRGDPVAIGIFEQAGRELGLQVRTVLRKCKGEFQGPVVASGGAWKGSGVMFRAMRDDVHSEYPDAYVTYPIFEPLVGSVILRAMNEGESFEAIEPVLRKEFSGYLYPRKA